MSKAVRVKYNILARLYDRIWPGYIKKTITKALEPLRFAGNERLIDIGCGTGALETALAEKKEPVSIVGIDISEDMLRQAQKKLANASHVVFKQGDFLNENFEENAFDIAFSISNFHYFSNPLSVLQKIAHLLKTGGKLILIDWNRNSFQGKIYNWYMGLFDPSFAKAYTPEEMEGLLEKTGFKLAGRDYFGVGLRWRMMRLVAIKA